MEILLYCRYSSELQNPKSIEDQEREVKEGLTRMGIDVSNATTISDAAVSGTITGREGFEQILERVRRGQPFILAVDDQSRLSRLDNAFALITDLVFAGGRFISTSEHIDTDTRGWKLRVRVMELHHSTCSDETGERVRRGQHGRIVQGLSAGDFPYGYESRFLDEKYAAAYCGRGPKPEKQICINEDQAKWVRWVFQQFAERKSINWIARELTKRKAPRDRRARASRWFASTIRKMLGNAKYIGIWRWGSTTVIRDSAGHKKQVAVPTKDVVIAERPDMRIIAQELWERVQTRLAQLRQKTGKKPNQLSRAPKVHYSRLYPKSIAQVLFVCGHCGARTHHQSSRNYVYRVCANSVDGRDSCPGRPHVPEKLARSILLNFVSQLLRSMPEWIDTAVREMNAAVQVYHEQLPTELKHSKAQLAVAEQRLEHLLQVAESGGAADVQSFGQRLKQAELEVNELRNDVERLKNVPPIPPQLPDKRWIASRLKKLAEAMAGDESNIAKLLGELIGSVRVYRVRLPGKKRGYHELRFRMNGWRVIRAAMQGTISREVLDVVESGVEASSCESPEVCLPVGGPTKLDVLAPQVAELRAQGMKWTEIGKLIGLSPDSAYQCWRRYTRACAAEEKRRRDAGDDSAQRDYGPGIREDDAAA